MSWRAAAYPIAVLWALTMSAVIVAIPAVISWATAPDDVVVDPLTQAADLWAIAMAPPIIVNDLPISLMPWGFALIWLALFWLGMRWAVTFAPGLPWRFLVGFVAAGALLTGGVAWAIGRMTTEQLGISAGTVAWHATAVALVGMVLAIVPDYRSRILERMPDLVRRGLWAALLAIFAVLAVASVLLLWSVAVHASDIIDIWSGLQPGAMGGLVLLVLQLGYLPILITWAAAYLTGAGIVIGELATMSPFIATTSAVELPPLPILAALPSSASMAMWLLPVVVIGIGAWSTRRVLRGCLARRLERLGIAGMSALVASIALAFLAALSSGSLGTERLAVVGPTPVVVAWLSFGLLTVGGALAAMLGTPADRSAPTAEIDAVEELNA
jgi:hypothetical protein